MLARRFIMADAELLVFVLAAFQGFFFFIFIFLSAVTRLLGVFFFQRSWASRKRVKTTRLFECAVYSRLNSQLRYSVQALGLLAAFVIYDVDLIFFLPEVCHVSAWAPHQAAIFAAYVGFFLFALAYDNKKGGFMWNS